MNLLGPGKKQEIKKERQRRLIVVAGIFLATLFSIAIILLLPSFFMLVFQQKYLTNQLAVAKQDRALNQAEEIELAIEGLNTKIKTFQLNKKGPQSPSQFFKEIIEVKPRDLSIESLIFEKSISLWGEAGKREDLIVFIQKLEDNNNFLEIVSPVSNLLKERDFKFSLSITLKNNEGP